MKFLDNELNLPTDQMFLAQVLWNVYALPKLINLLRKWKWIYIVVVAM